MSDSVVKDVLLEGASRIRKLDKEVKELKGELSRAMTVEQFTKLKSEGERNPTVIFSLRSSDMAKKDGRYRHIIFNHCQIHFSWNSEIVEVSGGDFDSPITTSADKYQDFGGARVILPLWIDESEEDWNKKYHRYEKNMNRMYNSCATFVRDYLVEAGLLTEKPGRIHVDELYVEMLNAGLIPTVHTVQEWHFSSKVIQVDSLGDLSQTKDKEFDILVKAFSEDEALASRMRDAIGFAEITNNDEYWPISLSSIIIDLRNNPEDMSNVKLALEEVSRLSV